jgi:RNA polymerase sigma-70 factor (ECF subfamily)
VTPSQHLQARVSADEFVRLVSDCQVRLRAYTSSLLYGASDVDDILQEVVALLWCKIAEYQPGTNFGAWACRVAYLKVHEFRRSRPREFGWSDEFLETLAIDAENCDDELNDQGQLLQDCLRTALDDSERALVLSRYQPNCSVKDLAKEAGVSEVTLRKRLRNALRELEICLSLKREWS